MSPYTKLILLLLIAVTLWLVDSASADEALDMARRLANTRTRQAAVKEVVDAGDKWRETLLQWTHKPPPDVDVHELYRALFQLFGEMKVKEAIPFLVRMISYTTWPSPVFGSRTDEGIIEVHPAIRALLRIGPVALANLEEALYTSPPGRRRLAILFTIAKMNHPDAKRILREAKAQAELELEIAVQGLGQKDGAPR